MTRRQRVLLVEDNPGDVELIREAALANDDLAVEIEAVGTLAAARDAVGARRFDLVLLDLGLPDSQGLATLEALRAVAPSLATIVVTGSPEQALACFRGGAHNVLDKSAGGGLLVAGVAAALRTRRLEAELQDKVLALEESEARYHSLFDRMLDGFADHEVICDDAGSPVDYRFLAINPAFERQTGLRAHDLIGRRVLEVMPETERHWIETYGRVGLTGQPTHFESYAAELGKHFEVTAFQSRPGHFACLFLDVTARKQAEAELRRFNDELERRVELRTADLRAANEELDAFASSVSHDLRAPLRAITGFAEILAARYRARLDDKARHYFDNIIEAGDRMGRLLEDLRRYARLGKGGVELRRLEPRAALGAVVGELGPKIAACQAEVSLPEVVPAVTGAEGLLRQALAALLDNALTFHDVERAPRIEVSVRIAEDWVVIAVADNGIGIAPEHHHKVFDLFQRLHPRERYPGTGVGLALARKAALLMKGTIDVRSKPGEGSVFEVALPRAPRENRGAEA